MPHSSHLSKVAIAKSRPVRSLTGLSEVLHLLRRLFLTIVLVLPLISAPKEGLHVESNWAEKHPCLHLLREIQDNFCHGFATSSGDCSHTSLRNQFYIDSCFRFAFFQSKEGWAKFQSNKYRMWRWGKINPTPGVEWNVTLRSSLYFVTSRLARLRQVFTLPPF